MSKYLTYTHSQINERTLGSFLKKNSVFFGDDKTITKDFLLFSDENGVTNIDRIYEVYFESDKQKYKSTYLSLKNSSGQSDSFYEKQEVYDLPLYIGTTLLINSNNFNTELVSVVGKNLFLEQSDDFNFLWSEKLYKLTTSDGYVRSQIVNLGEGFDYNIEIINQNIQVWVWVRALNKIINLSPFVLSCNTSKTDVGSFSITFNPIKNLNRLEIENSENIIDYFNIDEFGYVNVDFIHQHLQMNDIVFIRFEKLQLEDKNSGNNSNEYQIEIGKDSLPGRVWDMIGLIDNNSLRANVSDTNYEITITGRDLMKLLVEDASYWIASYYLESEKSIINFGYNEEDKWFKRNLEGGFGSTSNTPSPYSFIAGYRSINDTIGFIVNQLSNLGVTGDINLFENYGDRRTRAYRVTGSNDSIVLTKNVEGVWQIVKVFFDKILQNRRVIDESLARSDGRIIDQFNKVCQKPFVEFYGDTFGDEFNLIIRQPPFTKGAITSFLQGVEYHPNMDGTASRLIGEDRKQSKVFQMIEIDLKDIQNYDNLSWDNTYYASYQIEPKNEMIGAYSNIMLGGMVPIIYIEEIAKLFGNNKFSITDNYVTIPIPGKEFEDDNSYRTAILNDFKYVLDTNFYLPFTRRGSLTLSKGDRRIKKGIFIKIKPTNEIFYVDSVSNSVSFSGNRIERSTNIQVSRGMIEDYIYGANGYNYDGSVITSNQGNPIKFSYFDILRTIITKKTVKRKVEPQKTIVNKSYYNKKYSVEIGAKGLVGDRHNNPGNLVYARQNSATKGEIKGSYIDQETGLTRTDFWAKFETPEIGFDELIRQLGLYSIRERTDTIEKMIRVYAPSNENETEKYINQICLWVNKSRSTKLIDIDHFELAKAIAKKESLTIVKEFQKLEEIKEEPVTQDSDKVIETTESNLSWIFDKDQFEFFIGRKQFNLIKFKQNASGN